ncbi:Crp/Fnr family transcriptional regulator [Billgrantia endophytica]|nr:cyclic nucleotide-binding domain-containing protein [Halomonas endophytica]
MSAGLLLVANMLFCLSYMMRDMAYLRVITIVAAFFTLPYFYFQIDSLYSALGWPMIFIVIAFIVINAFNLTVLLLQRRAVSLDQRQSWLHQHTFQMLSPREMLKILQPSVIRRCEAGETLVRQGEQPNRLILILDGAVHVHTSDTERATLRSGDFVGEMSFITGKPSSADVVASEPLDYLIWRRGDLESIYKRMPHLKDAMQSIIGADMARKLAR